MLVIQKFQEIVFKPWSLLVCSYAIGMVISNAVIFFHPKLDGLHLVQVEYENTLAIRAAWSDPCGFWNMVIADGLFKE
jgi:hypothetical protein